jgi:hypothetical protein
MVRSTLLLSIALTFSLLGSALLAYLWIDRSISLGYLQQSYDTERSSVESLQKLVALEWKGLPEDQIKKKLEKAASQMPGRGVVVKKEGSVIWFDQVAFNIKKGKLDTIGRPKDDQVILQSPRQRDH